jgi:hypothetical protein
LTLISAHQEAAATATALLLREALETPDDRRPVTLNGPWRAG